MRSDKNIKPSHYDLEFDLDLEEFSFKGKETIDLRIDEKTDKIVLNSADLDITEVEVFEGENEIEKDDYEIDPEDETLTIDLSSETSGNVKLYLEFEGEISDGLAGLYRGRYNKDGEEKFLATTQFEPADARRAFPCFDEPSMKATFDITMIVDKDLTAISNMPVIEEEDHDGKKKFVFDTTPKMSTYLVYLSAGEFDFIEDDYKDTKLRVATTPGKIEHGKFALESAKKILEYYNNYFGIDYQLPKLDQIAIPDFAAGAMENWGAITYREVALLYDPDVSSTSAKQRIFEVIAHEMAHQWFGNLVTMEWWNDLWLNESFATWLAFKTMAHFYPEWDAWSKFVDEETAGALGLDALKSSHSIEAKIDDPADIPQIFDAISYNKGASVLRMLESHIGEKAFREGIRNYMEEHQYKNTETEDLWNALSNVSDLDVREMMNGWIKQVGYPMVSASLEGNDLKLEQKRFLFEDESDDDTTWMIPIEMKSPKSKSFVMKERKETVEIEDDIDYVKLNVGQSAFFRTNYSDELLEKLKEKISEGGFSSIDRWGIQNDIYALAKSCEIDFDTYLDFIDHYSDEKDYLVCSDIAGHLYGVYRLAEGEFQKKIKEHAVKFYKNIMEWLTWDAKEDEHENLASLRSQVLVYLARMGDTWTIREAQGRFQKLLNGREDIDPNLRGALYSIVAWDGDEDTYDKLKELYENAEHPEEERRLLSSLGAFSNEDLLSKTLDYTFTENVRKQDGYVPVLSVAGNPNGRDLAWPWVKDNWSKLEEIYGKGGNVKLFDTFVRPIGLITDINEEKRINEFFKDKDTSKIDKTLTQSLEKLRINHKFLKYNNAL